MSHVALSRHQVNRIFSDDTCFGSIWPLLLQFEVQILCSGENFQGPGELAVPLCMASLDAGPVLNGTVELVLFHVGMRILRGESATKFTPVNVLNCFSPLPRFSPSHLHRRPHAQHSYPQSSQPPSTTYALHVVFCPENKATR